MRAPLLLDLAQRHGLDQRQIVPLARAPAEHRRELVFVQALECDHVDFDLQPRCRGCLDSAEHLGKIAAPRDVPETRGIAAVEAHVDAADTRVEQLRSKARELRPVGRHG